MKEKFYPRLCGGTFLSLLLQFRKPRTAVRGGYFGMSDGMSEPDMLLDLIRVAYPAYEPPHSSTLKNNTSRYKCCQLSAGTYLPFHDSCFVDFFDREIREDYHEPERRIHLFFSKYIEIMPSERTSRLVMALMELLDSDESIAMDERLYVRSGGLTFAKHELLTARDITIPEMLLGLWHYIVTQRPDNTIGIETYEHWFAPPEQSGAKRKFISDIGQAAAEAARRRRLMCDSRNIPMPVPADEAEHQVSRTGYDYAEYRVRAAEKYGALKTLLYTDAPKPFYDIYVCNDISKYERGRWSEECPEKDLIHDPNVTDLMKNFGRRIILYGTGGIGKSMMMRHLLLDAITEHNFTGRVPFFVPLKDYDGVKQPLVEFIHGKIAGLCQMTIQEMDAALNCGEIIVLFDGLDEIKSRYIADFERQLDEFSDRFPNSMIIISSRPSRDFVSYSKFVIVEVRPFSKAQALTLIDKLEYRPDEPEIKQKFRERLDDTYYETHREFASTPLLLTIMLMTFEQYAELPAKMHLFYREAFYTMAQRHDASKGAYRRELNTGLSPDRFADYFAEFCARTYYGEKIDFTWFEFEQYFKSLNIVNLHPEEKVTARDFLEDLMDNLCLIYFEGSQYRFTHRSFQEYFCALYFSKQKDRTLASVGAFFEKSYPMDHAYVFKMLYDLIPEKVDEYIMKPQLEKLFSECDKEDGYWTYLMIEHPVITYSNKVTGPSMFDTNVPRDCWAHCLVENLMDSESTYLTDMPAWDEYILECVGNDTEYRDSNSGIHCRIEFDDHDEQNSIYGFWMSFSVPGIWNKRKDFSWLMSLLDHDDFPLKREYEAMRNYYKQMIERRSSSDNGFFSQFS